MPPIDFAVYPEAIKIAGESGTFEEGPMARAGWSQTRREFHELRPRSTRTICAFLGHKGVEFDRMLKQQIDTAFETADDDSWFVPAASIALQWSRHAKPEELPAYLEFASESIRSGRIAQDGLRRFSWRFGQDGLKRSLEGYHAVARERPDLVQGDDFPSPSHLRAHQNRMIGALLEHPVLLNTPGVGAWLGLAPYKIMLVRHENWWNRPESDQVLQPLGSIAERALRLLADDRVVSKDQLTMLHVDDESVGSSRAEAFTSTTIAQGIQVEIARQADSRVMHINSALYDLAVENQ